MGALPRRLVNVKIKDTTLVENNKPGLFYDQHFMLRTHENEGSPGIDVVTVRCWGMGRTKHAPYPNIWKPPREIPKTQNEFFLLFSAV
jgi:hypothetical protein